MQGYSAGVSNAFGVLDINIKDRHRMVGNAFRETLTHAIFSRWPGTHSPSIYAVHHEKEDDHTTPLERVLSKLTDQQLEAWMAKS